MFLSRLSFRMQIVLVFILCLLLLGTGVILLNAYWISALEQVQRQQAHQMAEEQGRRAVQAILDALEQGGQEASLQTLQSDTNLAQRLNAVLGNYLAVRVVNENREVVMTTVGSTDIEISMETEWDAEGNPLPLDFRKIQLHLRQQNPELRTVPLEIPIHQGQRLIGYLDFLVQESAIGRDMEMTGRQIGRLLWSLVFAFVSVLALGIYLVMLLSRRQVHLLAENEKLGRMAYVGTLASGLAHEIRNPLNAIAVNLSVAREELESNDPQSPEVLREAMGFMGREVERMNHSMTSFLAFARPEESQCPDDRLTRRDNGNSRIAQTSDSGSRSTGDGRIAGKGGSAGGLLGVEAGLVQRHSQRDSGDGGKKRSPTGNRKTTGS
jgi:K+-sensing histidine kinase KdpD